MTPPLPVAGRYTTYLRRVDDYQTQHPHQRRGQVYYNVLRDFDPEAVDYIRDKRAPLNPFNTEDPTDLAEFRAWLRARWDEL